ncbi:MAG: response regulator, partial [Bdellovibrionota bacterium]
MSSPRPRILLIEDEKTIALGISYNLKKNGYDVELAEDGQQGLGRALEKKFDLIILDVMLPRLDGLSVCKELRRQRVWTPILMLTARSETHDRVQGIKLGADDYLGKPFSLDELFVRITALLRRREWDSSASTRVSIEQERYELGEVLFDSNLQVLFFKEKRV